MTYRQPFGLQRKIVADRTSAGWKAPHGVLTYETDVSALLRALEERNAARVAEDRISLNTALLWTVVQGLKACPKLNGHIAFPPVSCAGRRRTARR